MFSVGTYFKIWNVTNKGNYSEVECSTSAKNKMSGRYETDFSSKFVRFIGNAHNKSPQPNEKIKVTNCAVQNVYEKDGQKQYLKNPTYMVFDFERDGQAPMPSGNGYMPSGYGGNNSMSSGFEEIPSDSSLPF